MLVVYRQKWSWRSLLLLKFADGVCHSIVARTSNRHDQAALLIIEVLDLFWFWRLLGAGVEFRPESTLGPFQDDFVGKSPVMGPSHGMSTPAFTVVDTCLYRVEEQSVVVDSSTVGSSSTAPDDCDD